MQVQLDAELDLLRRRPEPHGALGELLGYLPPRPLPRHAVSARDEQRGRLQPAFLGRELRRTKQRGISQGQYHIPSSCSLLWRTLTVIQQVINILNDTVPLTVNLPQPYRSVNGTILTAPDLNSYNYIHNQTEVVLRPLNLTTPAPSAYGYGGNGASNNGSFQWNVPRYSSTVLQFDL